MAELLSPVYPPRDQLELLNEELHKRAELQSDELEGLDRKASTVLGATGVVLALVVNNARQFHTVSGEARNVFFGSLVILAVGLVVGLLTLFPRDIKVVPNPRHLLEQYYAASTEETLAQLAVTRLRAFEENRGFSLRKGWGVRAQIVLLASGGTILVAAYLLKEFAHA